MGVPAGLLLSTVVFNLFTTNLTRGAVSRVGLARAVPAQRAADCRRYLHPPEHRRVARVQRRFSNRAASRRGRWSSRVRDYRRNVLLAMGMRVAENGLFYVYTVFVLSYGPGELGTAARHDAVGRQPGGARRAGRDSALRRAVGSDRPPAGLPVRRHLLAVLRVSVLLAARHASRRPSSGSRLCWASPSDTTRCTGRRRRISPSCSAPACATAAHRSGISSRRCCLARRRRSSPPRCSRRSARVPSPRTWPSLVGGHRRRRLPCA